MNLEIRAAALDSPEAVTLDDGLQQEYLIRYGGVDATPVRPAEFAPPAGAFLVAWLDGQPVACGGFRTVGERSEGGPGDGTVEIKKMYVVPAARGMGVAKRMLAALEGRAVASGCREVILETGSVQPEAFALYTSHGYRSVPAFGIYSGEPGARHLGKMLSPARSAMPKLPKMPT
ncbi:MAG: GNAT family N-acetyltransferase [Pseudonocardiales bacterium]|nr:MAG: GNAT family N-acetyltransferase [Pseudonocardiales bacterium]